MLMMLGSEYDHGEHEKDRGDAQHDVHGPHDHAVHPAAVEPRDRAEDDADDRGDAHGNESDLKRYSAAPEHTREHVSSEVIGPQGMGQAGADKDVLDVNGGRVIGCDQWRKNGKNEDEQHEYSADDGQAVLHEVVKGLGCERFAITQPFLRRKVHCEHPQGARQSLLKNEIALRRSQRQLKDRPAVP
jgi:hypothetical protein